MDQAQALLQTGTKSPIPNKLYEGNNRSAQMKQNTAGAVAEFRRVLERKKLPDTQAVETRRGRASTVPFEEGEAAAEEAIKVFKKEIEKMK